MIEIELPHERALTRKVLAWIFGVLSVAGVIALVAIAGAVWAISLLVGV